MYDKHGYHFTPYEPVEYNEWNKTELVRKLPNIFYFQLHWKLHKNITQLLQNSFCKGYVYIKIWFLNKTVFFLTHQFFFNFFGLFLRQHLLHNITIETTKTVKTEAHISNTSSIRYWNMDKSAPEYLNWGTPLWRTRYSSHHTSRSPGSSFWSFRSFDKDVILSLYLERRYH